MSIDQLWIIFTPLVFGVAGCYFFIHRRSLKRKTSFLDGFIGWLLFFLLSFIGELIAHLIHPSAYQGIGDNPAQVAGWFISILISFFLCPLIWMSFRRNKKIQDNEKLDKSS